MLIFLLFYLVIWPLTVLLHEIGHGLGVVFTSNSHAHIYLGNLNENNRENFRLGRLHFHIIWSYGGFCYWENELNKKQRVISLVCGPAMSLLVSIVCLLFALNTSQGDVHSLLRATAILTFSQFLITIIPITYPRWWMRAYNGYPSDGLQLLRLLKN